MARILEENLIPEIVFDSVLNNHYKLSRLGKSKFIHTIQRIEQNFRKKKSITHDFDLKINFKMTDIVIQ